MKLLKTNAMVKRENKSLYIFKGYYGLNISVIQFYVNLLLKAKADIK
jgi:hypothetical protein